MNHVLLNNPTSKYYISLWHMTFFCTEFRSWSNVTIEWDLPVCLVSPLGDITPLDQELRGHIGHIHTSHGDCIELQNTLTHNQVETHMCVISIVNTDALVTN